MIQSVQKPSSPALPGTNVSQEYDADELQLVELSDSIKVNLLPEANGKEHMALVSVSVGVAGPADATKKEKKKQDKELGELVVSLTEKEPIIRDVVIRQLRKATYSELRQADGQEILERSITSELQNTFNTNYIVNVFFKELFLQ